MIQAKFSNKYYAKQKRIKNLPRLIDGMLFGVYKKDAVGVIREYQNGIRSDSLGLERLKPGTTRTKENKGLSKPHVPLYAWGDDEKMSLINCLRLTKLKNGWKIRPSKGLHHKKDGGKPIALDFLHKIHENGAIIQSGKKPGKDKKQFGPNRKPIRIPSRPALTRAYRFYLAKMKKNKKETSRTVKAAMTLYIETANMKEINNLTAFNNKFKELERE
jgi:hypothetical protein